MRWLRYRSTSDSFFCSVRERRSALKRISKDLGFCHECSRNRPRRYRGVIDSNKYRERNRSCKHIFMTVGVEFFTHFCRDKLREMRGSMRRIPEGNGGTGERHRVRHRRRELSAQSDRVIPDVSCRDCEDYSQSNVTIVTRRSTHRTWNREFDPRARVALDRPSTLGCSRRASWDRRSFPIRIPSV